MKLMEFETLESTNDYCQGLSLEEVEEYTVVWAHRQTAGRGQRGNRWESEGEANLTLSVVLHPRFLEVSNQYALTKVLALGVSDWLSEEGVENSIKWPNDIYAGGRKICGILVENHIGKEYESAVCGIGVNVNQSCFGEGAPNATSLRVVTGREYDLRSELLKMLAHIESRYEALRAGGGQRIDEDYLKRLLNLGLERTYRYEGKEVRATITGVTRFGHLQLCCADGREIECDMKEIVFMW